MKGKIEIKFQSKSQSIENLPTGTVTRCDFENET